MRLMNRVIVDASSFVFDTNARVCDFAFIHSDKNASRPIS